jgi:dTDP-4-amino-4,6-dideoxygalactose transaminase
MLLTKNQQDRQKALHWSTQSREPAPWYQHEEIGYNYRMSNIVAGIGRGQLLHLQEHIDKKTAIYRRYEEGLKGLPLTMNPYLSNMKPNFWLSCLLLDKDCGVTAMELLRRLQDANIESRPIWKPMHMQPVFAGRDFITAGEAAVDEDIFERGLCLPSDLKMTEQEQDYVIEIIRMAFEQ